MRQFAAQQKVFVEPARRPAGRVDPGMVNMNHLLLLAIERTLAPPVVHRRSIFQPMRIIVVDPALMAGRNPGGDEHVEMPKVLPRALPPGSDLPHSEAAPFRQRAVRGEILSDESGRLYEKVGRQIRPIHQLASGQFGDVIDLVPATQATTRMIPLPAGPRAVDRPVMDKPQSVPLSEVTKANDSEKSDFEPLGQTKTPPAAAVSHRKLFADPGQWRVVWWGEFKEILARQLAHPERLRDTYRLPCYVQVLETERAVSIEELAAVYKSENEHHGRLFFLTDEIAAKLDLVLPLRPAPPHHARREPNTLPAHERVFRLLVANDPTIDVTMSKTRLQSSPTRPASLDGLVKASDAIATPKLLKEAIPNSFVKEWQLKLSREEAAYEMTAKPGLSALVLKFLRSLRVVKQANEFRKWQTLLAGRSVDEQLWAVRPPAGKLVDPLVRRWVSKTLELGGYDSRKMIIEWEIFWRRRGL